MFILDDWLRRRANARNVSFRISLRWLTYIVNSVDKTKLFYIRQSSPVVCLKVQIKYSFTLTIL